MVEAESQGGESTLIFLVAAVLCISHQLPDNRERLPFWGCLCTGKLKREDWEAALSTESPTHRPRASKVWPLRGLQDPLGAAPGPGKGLWVKNQPSRPPPSSSSMWSWLPWKLRVRTPASSVRSRRATSTWCPSPRASAPKPNSWPWPYGWLHCWRLLHRRVPPGRFHCVRSEQGEKPQGFQGSSQTGSGACGRASSPRSSWLAPWLRCGGSSTTPSRSTCLALPSLKHQNP